MGAETSELALPDPDVAAESTDVVVHDPDVVIENIEAVSHASSHAPSQCTARLEKLFPSDKCAFGAIERTSHLYIVLKDCLGLPVHFLACLAALGLSTPAILVNSFGLDIRSIAHTFGLMGSHYVLDILPMVMLVLSMLILLC